MVIMAKWLKANNSTAGWYVHKVSSLYCHAVFRKWKYNSWNISVLHINIQNLRGYIDTLRSQYQYSTNILPSSGLEDWTVEKGNEK